MTAWSYYTSALNATESYCTRHVFISSKAFSSTPFRRSRVRHEAGGLPVAQQHRAGRRRSSDRWHTVFILVLRSYASVCRLRCLHRYGTVRSDPYICCWLHYWTQPISLSSLLVDCSHVRHSEKHHSDRVAGLREALQCVRPPDSRAGRRDHFRLAHRRWALK